MNLNDNRQGRQWPRFAIDAQGRRLRVDCMGDIPIGGRLEKPLPADPTAPVVDVAANLRTAYQTLTGKKPGPMWDAARLSEEIAKAAGGDA